MVSTPCFAFMVCFAFVAGALLTSLPPEIVRAISPSNQKIPIVD